MKVQELIDSLNEVEDKSSPVKILVEFGRGCWSLCEDPKFGHEEDGSVLLSGEEDRNDSE